MDGHPSGVPQGPGGQNPAYRPAHRATWLVTASSSPLPRALLAASVAGLAGSIGLGAKSLWFDEAYSALLAASPSRTFFAALVHGDPNMTLYSVVLHGWVGAFGTSEAALRALSVVAFALAAFVVTLLGHRLFGEPAGGLSGLVFAASSFGVTYAQDARGYALFALLASASSLAFLRALDRPSAARLSAYVLASALALYAHFFALFVLAAHALSLPAMPEGRRAFRRFAAAWGGVAAAGVPLLLAVLSRGEASVAWIPRPTLGALGRFLLALAGSAPLLAADAVLVGIAIRRALAAPRGAAVRRGTLLAGLLLVVPVLGAFAVSFARPLFVDYYLIEVLAPLAMLVGSGLAGVPSVPGRALAAAGFAALAGFALVATYDAPPKEDWRAAAAYLARHVAPGQAVLAPLESEPLVYYLEREPEPWRFRGALPAPSACGDTTATACLLRWPVLYLVTGPQDVASPVPGQLIADIRADRFVATGERAFPGLDPPIEVVRFALPPAPAPPSPR
jgi:mannosyltransferase